MKYYHKLKRNYALLNNTSWSTFIQEKRVLDRIIAAYHTSKIYWHPRRFYRHNSNIKIQKPIFLLGTQGGGLTLISRFIRLLPNMVYISGNARYWAGPDELHNNRRFKHLPNQFTLRSPGYNNMLGNETHHPEFKHERAFLYATDEMIDQYRLTDTDWTPELDAQLKKSIQTCLRTYADDLSSARFQDMSQTFSLKIPFLRRCFPDAQFIIISRNPYAVCWKEVQTSLAFLQNPMRATQLAANHWYNTFSYALSDTKNCSNTLFLRFEDFIQSPQDQLAKIYTFLNEPTDVSKLLEEHPYLPKGSISNKKWLPVNSTVNDKYLKAIPQYAKDIITREGKELIDQLGYTETTPQLSNSFDTL